MHDLRNGFYAGELQHDFADLRLVEGITLQSQSGAHVTFNG